MRQFETLPPVFFFILTCLRLQRTCQMEFLILLCLLHMHALKKTRDLVHKSQLSVNVCSVNATIEASETFFPGVKTLNT